MNKKKSDIVELLQKEFRTHEETDKLAATLRSFKFFKEHNIRTHNEMIDIAHCLNYTHADAHDIVFNYGD